MAKFAGEVEGSEEAAEATQSLLRLFLDPFDLFRAKINDDEQICDVCSAHGARDIAAVPRNVDP